MDVDKVGVTLTDQNFQRMVLESQQPVLVAFWAEGCGPWHMLAPEVAALAEAGEARAVRLRVRAAKPAVTSLRATMEPSV